MLLGQDLALALAKALAWALTSLRWRVASCKVSALHARAIFQQLLSHLQWRVASCKAYVSTAASPSSDGR